MTSAAAIAHSGLPADPAAAPSYSPASASPHSLASAFDSVAPAPPDAILSVGEAFALDPRPHKLNLGVGAYRTDEMAPLLLSAVRKAEAALAAQWLNKEYLPADGWPAYRAAATDVLLGAGHPATQQGRVAAVQTVSGTGALLVAGAFIARHLAGRPLYLPSPSWAHHYPLFTQVGLAWRQYRYYDSATNGLDWQGLVEDLAAAPEGSVVLLHGCAHNPTGVDPSRAQWLQLAELCRMRQLVPLFDMAYQGFASGCVDADAFAVRHFVDVGLEVLVAQTFSKIMGLYSERVGTLIAVTATQSAAARVGSQFKRLACTFWLNPPAHGARIVAEVVCNAALNAEWRAELAGMVERIKVTRAALRQHAEALCPSRDWKWVTAQCGMFSYTNLRGRQVQHLRSAHAVYITPDGRLNMAGLPCSRAADVAAALVDAVGVDHGEAC